jgi:hypothetical protein
VSIASDHKGCREFFGVVKILRSYDFWIPSTQHRPEGEGVPPIGSGDWQLAIWCRYWCRLVIENHHTPSFYSKDRTNTGMPRKTANCVF